MSQELNGTLTNSANLVGTFGSTGGGTSNYNDLTNKPQINGVELQGNKTTSNLNISYNDIGNKPTINGVELQGNKTTSNLNISYNDLKNKPTLATVATSGSYDDLTNTPTIPAAQVNSDWNSSSGVSEILNKPTIPTNSDFSLSGLSDTNITTPSAGQVLAYASDGNGGVEVVNSEPLVKGWTGLGSFVLSGNQTGTWTLNNDMTGAKDIIFMVGFGASDNIRFIPRCSLLIPYAHFFTYGAFFEFGIIGVGRQYVELQRQSGNKITVSNTAVETQVTLTAYCR